MKENGECPYLIDVSNGLNKIGNCILVNKNCGLIRYCRDKNKVVSSELYHLSGCNIKDLFEKEKK